MNPHLYISKKLSGCKCNVLRQYITTRKTLHMQGGGLIIWGLTNSCQRDRGENFGMKIQNWTRPCKYGILSIIHNNEYAMCYIFSFPLHNK